MNRRFEMARHAYTTVPFYRELAEKEPQILMWIESGQWEKLPLVEKEEIVLQQDKLISDDYLGYLYGRNLIKTNTSGTTGICLEVCWHKQDYNASLLPLWLKRYEVSGIKPMNKGCFFINVLENNLSYKIVGNNLFVSKVFLGQMKFEKLNKILSEFKPEWMIIYPGLAVYLCDLIEQHKIDPIMSIKYIELTGESVLKSSKDKISNVFNCVVAEHYGTKEVNSIGYKVSENAFDVFQNSCYVEVLDENGEKAVEGTEGNVYITSIHNYMMPFVRYGTGDRGIIVNQTENTAHIQLTASRKNDYITLETGVKVASDILLTPVDVLNRHYGNIVYQFQAIQKNCKNILIRLNIDKEIKKEFVINSYINIFNEISLFTMNFEFEFIDFIIPNNITGKISWFENKCKK